jgi:hypothetical protein
VGSPQWLRISKTVKIAKKRTADVSATPTMGEKRAPAKALSAVDVDEIKSLMAETVEKARANDPAELRKENADLRLRLQNMVQRETAAMTAVQAAAPKKVEVLVLKDQQLERAERLMESLAKIRAAEIARQDEYVGKLSQIFGEIGGAIASVKNANMQKNLHNALPATAPRPTPKRSPAAVGNGSMGSGEVQVLTAIAQHPAGAGRELISVLTGFKKSTRDAYIQRLSSKGFVSVQGLQIYPTPAGVDALGKNFQPLPTGKELQAYWLGRLPEGERKVLEAIIVYYPRPIDRGFVSEATGFKKSTRDAYIQRLKARRLVVDAAGGVKASDNLFD